MHCGQSIVFSGCRSWHNSDDGWDLFETDYGVTLTNCWQWHSGDGTDFMPFFTAKTGGSGSFQGNGNGLKLGGDGAGGPSLGIHVVANCVAFNNKYKSNANGITQNSHHDGQIIYNLDTRAPAGVTMVIGQCYRLDAYLNGAKLSYSRYAVFQPTK